MATFSMTAMRGALPGHSCRSAAAPRIAQPARIAPQSFTGFAREDRLGLSTGIAAPHHLGRVANANSLNSSCGVSGHARLDFAFLCYINMDYSSIG